MPKVAFISTGFGSKIGGLGLYAEVVTNELGSLGVETIKISLSNTSCDYHISSVCRFPNYLIAPHFKRQLEDILRKKRPDIIHLNIASPQVAMVVNNVLEKLDHQFILTVHSYVFLCPTDRYVKLPNLKLCNDSWFNFDCMKCIYLNQVQQKQSALTKFTEVALGVSRSTIASSSLRMLLRKAKIAISPSKKLADSLRCGLGSENITHIYNPVPRKLLSQNVCPKGDGTVLFMNRLVSEKGVHLLPKFTKLLSSVTKINVIGKGPLGEWLAERKSDKMVYHGFIPEKVKTDMLKKCSVVIVPSIRAECFPYVVLEAFSLGKPVIGFALGGVEEQVKESKGGKLAEPFNVKDFAYKVNYLLENTDEAMKMGLNGRKWIEENCDPRLYVKNLLHVYKELY